MRYILERQEPYLYQRFGRKCNTSYIDRWKDIMMCDDLNELKKRLPEIGSKNYKKYRIYDRETGDIYY